MKKIQITLHRMVPQTLVTTVEVDDGAAAYLLDPANAKDVRLWADQQGKLHGKWENDHVFALPVDAKWREVE